LDFNKEIFCIEDVLAIFKVNEFRALLDIPYTDVGECRVEGGRQSDWLG